LNAAQLVGLAQARGIDLSHVAGVASNVDGIAQERSLTLDEKKLGIRDVRLTVRGRETRSARRPSWSAAELSQAAAGLGPVPWNAALYSFAGAKDGYWLLWHALASEAHRLARRESWAPRVTKADGSQSFFRESLAELVLVVDANRHLFVAAPTLHAIYMGVNPAVWDQQLDDPFRSLKAAYERWLTIARVEIGRWIRGD
jgi:hypothetical protein